jgi:hypothetical protein
MTDAGPTRLARADPHYPLLLREIHDPPPTLYLRGAGPPELLSASAVAIVGARACSPYGAQVGRMLGRELAAAGLVVVSGLARGIDGEAHRGALDAGGVTIAVLGCGIDRDYPAVHAQLARRICERGLVVSEYEPGLEPAPWRFPARKGGSRGTMRIPPNHAIRTCRARRRFASRCGPGVVSRRRRWPDVERRSSASGWVGFTRWRPLRRPELSAKWRRSQT